MSARPAESDEALMARYVLEDDKQAFREIFDRYGDRLHGWFLRAVGDETIARDMVQTTFLHLHRARRDFDTSRTLRPWIFTIAANVKRMHFRRKRRKPEAPFDPETDTPSVSPDASTATERVVRRAVEGLPDGQRDVILLRWYSELAYKEIGQSLGITANAAKVRAHRAMKKLRETLLGGDDG